MPNYIDPTVTIQLWAANDAVLQGVSAKFTKDSKARLAMTEGTLHLLSTIAMAHVSLLRT